MIIAFFAAFDAKAFDIDTDLCKSCLASGSRFSNL